MISGTGAGVACSLQRSRTTRLSGESPDEPWRCPGQSPCQHNPHYTRHPPWCLFDNLGWRSQMAFLCTCTQHFLQVLPTGLWTLVAGATGAPVVPPGLVCRRPLGRVEEASLMSLPRAPELQNVTAGKSSFSDLLFVVENCMCDCPPCATGPSIRTCSYLLQSLDNSAASLQYMLCSTIKC